MTAQPRRIRLLQLAIVLTAIFNILALVVFIWRDTPIAFTVFMFVGETLFGVALLLLLGAMLADLRAQKVL
jgi:hypothetical protein